MNSTTTVPRATRPTDKRSFSSVRKSEKVLAAENEELKSQVAELASQTEAAETRAASAAAVADAATVEKENVLAWVEGNCGDAVGCAPAFELSAAAVADIEAAQKSLGARAAVLLERVRERKDAISARLDSLLAD